MDTQLLESLGKIAGIGGISVGVLLILFREVIRRNIFPKLEPYHAYRVISLLVVLTFLVAVLGIVAWAYVVTRPRQETPSTRSSEGAERADNPQATNKSAANTTTPVDAKVGPSGHEGSRSTAQDNFSLSWLTGEWETRREAGTVDVNVRNFTNAVQECPYKNVITTRVKYADDGSDSATLTYSEQNETYPQTFLVCRRYLAEHIPIPPDEPACVATFNLKLTPNAGQISHFEGYLASRSCPSSDWLVSQNQLTVAGTVKKESSIDLRLRFDQNRIGPFSAEDRLLARMSE